MTSTLFCIGPVIDLFMSIERRAAPVIMARSPEIIHWFLPVASAEYISTREVLMTSIPLEPSPEWHVLHLDFFSIGWR